MVNDIDPVTQTSALFLAIDQLDHELIDKLCDKGAHTSSNDWQKLGELLIDLAKENNFIKMSSIVNLARRRPEIELDLDYRNHEGRTVLHYAAWNGNKEMVELVLTCGLGCDIMAMDNDGNNAADIAKQRQHKEV